MHTFFCRMNHAIKPKKKNPLSFLPDLLVFTEFIIFWLSCLALLIAVREMGRPLWVQKRWLSTQLPWMPKYFFSCDVLRCVVLCCAVLSCLVLSCLVLSCVVLTFLVLSLSCLVLSCLFWSSLFLAWFVLSVIDLTWLVWSYVDFSSLVLRCLVFSGLVLFCLVLFCRVESSLV